MQQLKKYLQQNYQLSNYQIAQIFFLFSTIASELSKIIILGIIFYSKWEFYLFALLITLFLRSAMGGLHFYTYIGCLFVSVLYFCLILFVFSQIPITQQEQIFLLLFTMLICYSIGPITSKYRPEDCKKHFQRGKIFTCMFIFNYALILYLIPENQYFTIGFWSILLHSLQLIIAKILKKGEYIIE